MCFLIFLNSPPLSVTVHYTICKGAKFSTTIVRPESELTAEMIQSGSWETLDFKQYNFTALGTKPAYGTLHPLMKVRSEIRAVFLEMGYVTNTNDFNIFIIMFSFVS